MINGKKIIADTLAVGGVNILLGAAGVIFRVYLTNKVGAAGMGLVQLVMSVYMFYAVFATSGISISVIRVVSESMARDGTRRIRGIMRVCLTFSALLGCAAGLLLLAMSRFAGGVLLQSPELSKCFVILSAGLPFMSIGSCLNGCFTALRQAVKSSVAYVIEDSFKMLAVIALFVFFPPENAVTGCIIFVISTASGEMVSSLFSATLFVVQMRKYRRNTEKTDGVLKNIVSVAAPVAVSAYVRSGLSTAENLLISTRLCLSGMTREEALSTYGILSGLVMPSLFFLSAFTGAFSKLLVPEITEAFTVGDTIGIRKAAARIINAVLLFSIGAAGIFMVFHDRLGSLLSPSQLTATMLFYLSPIVPMMYLDGVVDGILKGMNEHFAVMRYSLYEAAVRVLLVIFIIPRFGVAGLIVTVFAGNTVNAALSLRRLIMKIRLRISVAESVAFPLLCIAAASFPVRVIADSLSLSFFVCAPLTAVFYIGLLSFCRINRRQNASVLYNVNQK